MAIKKTPSGWLVDAQPGGRQGRRIRRTFSTKAEAIRFQNWIETQAAQGQPWNPAPADTRRLRDLIKLWYDHHGQTLRDGKGRRSILYAMADAMENPYATRFSGDDFADYRTRRLAAGINPNTLNHEHAYLRSVFNELRRLGKWQGANPLADVRQIRIPERELTWLNQEQIKDLLAALKASRNEDALRVTKLALATGARWSEAERLEAERLHSDRVIYAETKGGRVRAVPIAPALAEEMRTRESGRLFSSCYSAFRSAVERAGIELPRGQLAHVLRHTFASHFVMNGGHILTLQKILGHTDIKMTMRYAHLAPDHLQEAVALNPLARLG